ncbi:type II toxin-antitoxin system PemK/MazF family toxin [Dyadobacter sp. CY261]|nr:type II toxin-antitoxin system PemK/MazF family toxin [Dyadobacter sp. CY261]
MFFVSLDPTVGIEIKRARPCLIISPDEMNDHLKKTLRISSQGYCALINSPNFRNPASISALYGAPKLIRI